MLIKPLDILRAFSIFDNPREGGFIKCFWLNDWLISKGPAIGCRAFLLAYALI